MSETVNMPKLGFDMAEGTLVRWAKAEGENVTKGEILAEIETDKATVEVESPFSGVVARQLVTEQTSVPVGSAIAIIAAPGEKVDAAASAPAPTPAPAATPAPASPAAGGPAPASAAPTATAAPAAAPAVPPRGMPDSPAGARSSGAAQAAVESGL